VLPTSPVTSEIPSCISLFNGYVPNLGNDKKIAINQLISTNPANKSIVLGDFNCTLLKSLDRKPIPNRDDKGSTELKKYIERNDLIDVWRARNPNSKCRPSQFTLAYRFHFHKQ